MKNKIILIFVFFTCYCFSQNDCTNALVACGNSNYNNITVSGSGSLVEINANNSCDGQEINSLWIKVNIQNSGTLGFKLTPGNTSIAVDFDFYLFGPNATCGNLGNAIRCSTTNPAASNSNSNTTGMNQTETDVSEGPGQLGNNFVKWLNVTAGETYFLAIDRFDGDSDFSIDWTGTATFNQPPIINNVTSGATLNIEKCDSDTILDNSTSFNLTQNSIVAINGQQNIVATYHLSENDAIIGINSILNSSNYTNISNPQTVYIRLESTITKCFSTSSFNLIVAPFITADPLKIENCDDNNDGFVTFNLSQNNAVLTNGTSNLAITYHPNSDDTVTLPNNYTNQVAFTNEIVWAKIKNTVTGCYTYKPFDLIINTIPTIINAHITQCDFEVFPDGLTSFNLLEANSALTGSNANYTTKFYLNSSDAQANTNEINANYTNISNPQTIFVRVTNSTTSCFSVSQLTLNVNTNPTIVKTLYGCDDDGIQDGNAQFNLADAGFETSGNTVTYYTTSNDALHEQNSIATNTFSSQRIYARVENNNDCIGLNVIDLKVEPIPNFKIENAGFLCLNKLNEPITLSVQIINPSNYSYLWLPNGETSQNITASVVDNYSVTVTNIATNCSNTKSTQVLSSDIAHIKNIEITDLTDNNSVLINVTGNGNYVYNIDESFGTYQTSSLFENISSGFHTAYIKDLNGCGISEESFAVVGAPKFFSPNGDGYNDYWNIGGIDSSFYSKSEIYIFDRFGSFVTKINALGKGWDGTINGKTVTADDYWFTLVLENGRTAKGHFSLKR